MKTSATKKDLSTYEAFKASAADWLDPIVRDYRKLATLAERAHAVLTFDLGSVNTDYLEKYGRVLLTSANGRVKELESFLRKLYKACKSASSTDGFTQALLKRQASQIKDLCGVRFSCPYYDEVEPAVALLRTKLSERGHATDLQSQKGFADKNYLDEGDSQGYRSYHFYVRVATPTDIYGNQKQCLCEVQARSELQHVWAVKSHDLLYKPVDGWAFDPDVAQDMEQISHSLRVADQFLVSIRKRVRGKAP